MDTHTQDKPGYTAKILKHGSELIFDFSHLENQVQDFDFEQMVTDWAKQFDHVAKHCSAFILRLPNGEFKNFIPYHQTSGMMQ